MAITRAFKNAVHQERRKTPIVVNGDMAVAQRSTSVTGLGDGDEGYVTVDRMRHTVAAGAGRFTSKQTADAPNDSGFDKCLELDCTTADTSIAADEVFNLDYRIEGHDVQHLKYGTSDAEYLTVGFWMKADAAVAYSVGFIDVDNSRSIRSLFTTGTDWTYHCIPFIGDTVSGPNDDIGEGMRLRFTFHGGSNFTSGTLATSWEGMTNANRAVGQTINIGSSTDNEFYITGVQLEVGQNPTSFEHEPYERTLTKCQRYFYQIDHASDRRFGIDGLYSSGTGAELNVMFTHPTSMRAAPTLTVASAFSGTTTFDNDTQFLYMKTSNHSSGRVGVELGSGTTTVASEL